MENLKNSSALSQGNTNSLGQRVSGRNFQLTLNNEKNGDVDACNFVLMQKYNNLIKYLTGLKYRYIISCKEVNKKGFNHIHIYIQFDNLRKLSIKKCQGAHIEICKGSTQDNIDYIKKDGNILIELGNPKLNSYTSTIREIINHKNNDDLLDCDIKYINCINTIKNNSIQWLQTGEVDKKNIIITNKIDEYKKKYKFINVINGQYLRLDKNIIIKPHLITTSLVNDLLTMDNMPLNCKNQTYYVNDIKNIIFYYNNIDDFYLKSNFDKFRGLLKNHNVYLHFDNIRLNTMKNIVIDRQHWGDNHYKEYTGDYSEEFDEV